MGLRRPDLDCPGCGGRGILNTVWGGLITELFCRCLDTCDDHLDYDSPPCDQDECPIDPEYAYDVQAEIWDPFRWYVMAPITRRRT